MDLALSLTFLGDTHHFCTWLLPVSAPPVKGGMGLLDCCSEWMDGWMMNEWWMNGKGGANNLFISLLAETIFS